MKVTGQDPRNLGTCLSLWNGGLFKSEIQEHNKKIREAELTLQNYKLQVAAVCSNLVVWGTKQVTSLSLTGNDSTCNLQT